VVETDRVGPECVIEAEYDTVGKSDEVWVADIVGVADTVRDGDCEADGDFEPDAVIVGSLDQVGEAANVTVLECDWEMENVNECVLVGDELRVRSFVAEGPSWNVPDTRKLRVNDPNSNEWLCDMVGDMEMVIEVVDEGDSDFVNDSLFVSDDVWEVVAVGVRLAVFVMELDALRNRLSVKCDGDNEPVDDEDANGCETVWLTLAESVGCSCGVTDVFVMEPVADAVIVDDWVRKEGDLWSDGDVEVLPDSECELVIDTLLLLETEMSWERVPREKDPVFDVDALPPSRDTVMELLGVLDNVVERVLERVGVRNDVGVKLNDGLFDKLNWFVRVVVSEALDEIAPEVVRDDVWEFDGDLDPADFDMVRDIVGLALRDDVAASGDNDADFELVARVRVSDGDPEVLRVFAELAVGAELVIEIETLRAVFDTTVDIDDDAACDVDIDGVCVLLDETVEECDCDRWALDESVVEPRDCVDVMLELRVEDCVGDRLV
jgi:hypothetical protein